MSRLTRVQQQEQTHERLLAAGRSVLARRGFLAATVEEIAAEAGFTRGAVYKHFGGKEGLWQTLVDVQAEAHLQLLAEALDRVTDQRGLVATMTPVADENAARWITAAMEFAVAVARQPETATSVIEAQCRHEEKIVALLDEHCRRLRIRPALPLPHVVVLLSAMSGSLLLRSGMDPSVDVGAIMAGALTALFPEET
jgi:AcrR family transcriptional regulator